MGASETWKVGGAGRTSNASPTALARMDWISRCSDQPHAATPVASMHGEPRPATPESASSAWWLRKVLQVGQDDTGIAAWRNPCSWTPTYWRLSVGTRLLTGKLPWTRFHMSAERKLCRSIAKWSGSILRWRRSRHCARLESGRQVLVKHEAQTYMRPNLLTSEWF